MPYKSKADLERARYVTLAEAIDWVCQRDNCSQPTAIGDILKALADNALVVRWEDESTNPSSGPTKIQPVVPVARALARPLVVSAAGDLPIGRQWHEVQIEQGKVFDSWTGRWRTLLILKDSLFKAWSESSVASARGESEQIGPITKKNAGGRHSARDEFDQAYDQLCLQLGDVVKTMPPTELAKLLAKTCGKKLGEPGCSKRTVLGYIQRIRAKH